MNAEIIRSADKGRWKNTEALPWPIAMDCRKLVSIIGPKTMVRTRGVSGYSSLLRIYPHRPNRIMIKIS